MYETIIVGLSVEYYKLLSVFTSYARTSQINK